MMTKISYSSEKNLTNYFDTLGNSNYNTVLIVLLQMTSVINHETIHKITAFVIVQDFCKFFFSL